MTYGDILPLLMFLIVLPIAFALFDAILPPAKRGLEHQD